jgi:protoheme IX farnesyltransferase
LDFVVPDKINGGVYRMDMKTIRTKILLYWQLIKSLQTGLLMATGLAGYMSARCPIFNAPQLLAVAGSLFLSISGSTVLNMWYDRDIDARMKRTCYRPLSSGKISSREAFWVGAFLGAAGVLWATLIAPLYGMIVFAGLFFDVFVYTIWLKRRTCWSILWGGISGGMPVLAGRMLAVGHPDWIGIALAAGILFWIPTHIMTFSIRYHEDYRSACIPTFVSTYNVKFTRLIIAVSSILAALMMAVAAVGIGMQFGYLRLLVVLSSGLVLIAIRSLHQPSEKLNFGLFKYASLYMLSSMILMMIQ